MEGLARHLKSATKAPVKTDWVSGDEAYPLVTIIMSSASITPLDLSASKAIYKMEFQLDVWHTTAKKRDELVDRIIQYFETHGSALHQTHGWFDIRFEGLRDVDESGVFRKVIHLTFKLVG